MVLDDAASQNYHATTLGSKGTVVQKTNVLHKIDNKSSLSPGVKVNDITESSIGESRAENWDVVLPAPVVDAIGVIDLLTNASDYLGR